MNRNTWLALIVVILSCTNCNKSDKSPLSDFLGKKENKISGKEIRLVSDAILFKPFDFKIYDSLAVFNDNTGEAGFTIVNLNTGSLLKKFAFSGSDSSDFNINALSMTPDISSNKDFYITQKNMPFKIVRYNWDSILDVNSYKPNPFYYSKDFVFREAFLLNDTLIFGNFLYSKFDNKAVGIVNLSSGKLMTGIDVLNITGGLSKQTHEDSSYYKYLNVIMEDHIGYRPGSRYEFATFSLGGAIIRIFNVDKYLKFKKTYEKIYYLPKFSIAQSYKYSFPDRDPDCKNGFGSIAVTRDKIYALYNGLTLDNKYENEWYSNILLVFDWNGNPLEKIILDKKCARITIDNNNEKLLYGLFGTNNTQVVKYELH